MPIYLYKCKDCGETFEFLAMTFDEKPETCKKCGGTEFEKQPTTYRIKMWKTKEVG